MPLPTPAKFALMLGEPAWQRAAFDVNTALVDGIVQLTWDARHEGIGGTPTAVADTAGAGLAFDTQCRLFHSVPQENRVERWLWHAMDPGRPQHSPPPSDVLLDHLSAPQVLGALPRSPSGFAPVLPKPNTFMPRALACDEDGNLYVLDTAAHQVWVVDLAQRRVHRSEPVPTDAVHIAWSSGWLWVLCSSGAMLRLAATRVPQVAPVSVPVSSPTDASRLAFAPDGRLFVLRRAHAADASVMLLGRLGHWLATPRLLSFSGDNPFSFASGIAVSADGEGHPRLVVARRPEELFTCVDIRSDSTDTLLEPLAARHYDGAGIAATPDGRVVFCTPRGPRHATGARLHYRKAGRVVGFRLDAGQPQASWGRLMLDACLPANTATRVHALISDDDIEGPRLPRTAPANQPLVNLPQPDATPLPLVNELPADDAPGQLLFKRTDGSEQPWLVEPNREQDRFDTFEAIAPATRGRYLWLVFDLQGHSRATPRLRGVRAETPAHDWLRRLPQLYARQDAMRSFLQRVLAPMAGLEDDIAAQSDERHALLKPCSTPAAALPWLAHWVGLTLDERWSETARRSFIKEAPWLFRLRGTLWSLQRMVEIVTGARVVIVEQFRMRGLARVGDGAGVAAGPAWDEPAVLGMGMRVGGPVGNETVQGAQSEITDSFALNAHRFAVLVQAELDADTEATVRHLLDVHRPAHTLFSLCALGQGARIGRGLQIGLSTVVGPANGFAPLQLGAATLGRGQLLGRATRARGGLQAGPARLGQSSRIV